jgi:hypothetical protein
MSRSILNRRRGMRRLVGCTGEPYGITITTGLDDPGLFHAAGQLSRHLCDGAARDRGRLSVELWRVCGLVFGVDGRAGGRGWVWTTAALKMRSLHLGVYRVEIQP